MDLIRGGQLPLEEGQSQMRECAFMRGSSGEVFPLHEGVIGRRVSKGDAVSLVIGPHADEIAAPGNLPLEMVNARRFVAQPGRLVVTSVLVEPRDGTGVRAAIIGEGARTFRNGSCASA